MIRAIIIDDERLARVELKTLLSAVDNLDVVAEASNAEDGLMAIKTEAPDLIFLDIEMPGESGFDMLERMDEIPSVIFTTAFDEYAIKAFEFNALDYLLKPIREDRLAEAIKRATSASTDETTSDASEEILHDKLYVKDGTFSHLIDLTDVVFFSSFGNYVKIHVQHDAILIHRSLNQLEERVDPKLFFRANRYTLINLNHIKHISQKAKGKIEVQLSNDHVVLFSERKSVLFRERFGV